jgi:Predicted restriction endonuclease
MKGTFHAKLLTFLEKDVRIKDAVQREQLVNFAETKLPEFIRQYFDINYTGLYENTDRTYYERLRSNVYSSAVAKAANSAESEMYTTTLKHVAGFYNSKTFKGKEKVQLSQAEKAKPNKQYGDAPTSTTTTCSEPKTDYLQPSENEPLTEGKIRQVSLTIHERNRKFRQICLSEHGYVCAVCGMDFEKAYGEIGREFIEVHHLERIADTDGEHEINPMTDLVPLCSNCHSMIHRKEGGKPFTLDELKQRYKGPKWNEI